MIDTSLQKIKINQVIHSQLPSFVQEENPLFVDFLKTYYLGQEYRGGNIDIVQNLNQYQKVETFSGNENLIGLTTCTSEVNFFDDTINDVIKIIKSEGGLIYLDGANMNSWVGNLKPVDLGFDMMHINMHKTFAIPHGGGGPGVGAIGAK